MFISATPGLSDETREGLRANSDELGAPAIELSDAELYASRLQLAVETMEREMNSSWDRVSVINAKYGYQCKDLLTAIRVVREGTE
jgi:hypothetical protein